MKHDKLTLLDIVKGVLFSIGLYVVYILILVLPGLFGPIFKEASPLAYIVGFCLIVFGGIAGGYAVAVRFGFSVNDLFKTRLDKNKEK